MKTPEQLKRDTSDLLASEREKRYQRRARERILDAYDRLAPDAATGPNGCTCGHNGDCNCPFVES